MSVYLGDTLISGAEQFVGESRNIGQIIPSTIPLQDAGLHLLDGALIQGSGIYSAFVTYIAGLVTDYPNLFCTEADWQTSVTTYGVCGKFVYDNVNNTVRLPKITGILEGATDLTALGDLVEAGLPNITGTFNAAQDVSPTGVFQTDYTGHVPYARGDWHSYVTSFNASRSSAIYGNSNTVQPQAIKVLYYIVVATSTKTEIEVDIDEIATDLNGKADVDLSNVNNTAKTFCATASLPSSTYQDLTLGASGTGYTAPADGWVQLKKMCGASGQYFYLINDTAGMCCMLDNIANGYEVGGYIPVRKGDSFQVLYNLSGNTNWFRFIYAEGSKWEA